MPDRDQRKQLLLQARIMCPARSMSEGEATLFWKTFLDRTQGVPLPLFRRALERVMDREKWFPNIAGFMEHVRHVQDIKGTPTVTALVEQQEHQTQALEAPEEWTKEGTAEARKAYDAMPDNQFKKALGRVLEHKERA